MPSRVETGYLAFLDLLGFSSQLTGGSWKQIVDQYFEAMEESTDLCDASVQYVLFSDSLVMTTDDDKPASFEGLLVACALAVYHLLNLGVPVRGAVSHGPYIRTRTPHGTLVAGPPLVEAYHFQRELDWIGVSLSPSVLSAIPDLPSRCDLQRLLDESSAQSHYRDNLFFIHYVQPCRFVRPRLERGPNDGPGYAVVPLARRVGLRAMSWSLNETVKALETLRWANGDLCVQRKYTASIRWLQALGKQWARMPDEL